MSVQESLPWSILLVVRRHNSKFQANCSLFDTSMKFGTLIEDTKTSIFRYSAKPELRRFPWKPQFINIHGFSACFCFYYHFSGTNFPMYVLFYLACRTYPNLCVAMATENLEYHFVRKLMPSLYHMDMPFASLATICYIAYSCARNFVI